MYDTTPRDGVTARYATPTGGHRYATIRATTPVKALEAAHEECQSGHTLLNIHQRGNPKASLWTPEKGWIEGAASALKDAEKLVPIKR